MFSKKMAVGLAWTVAMGLLGMYAQTELPGNKAAKVVNFVVGPAKTPPVQPCPCPNKVRDYQQLVNWEKDKHREILKGPVAFADPAHARRFDNGEVYGGATLDAAASELSGMAPNIEAYYDGGQAGGWWTDGPFRRVASRPYRWDGWWTDGPARRVVSFPFRVVAWPFRRCC